MVDTSTVGFHLLNPYSAMTSIYSSASQNSAVIADQRDKIMRGCHKLTKMFLDDATDTFGMMAGDSSVFDVNRLPIALQSLGLTMQGSHFDHTVDNISLDLGRFLQIVSSCMDKPDWMVNEIKETFLIFDRAESGIAAPDDFKRVLTKLGENLTEKEIEEQIITSRTSQGFSVNSDKQLAVDDFAHACKNTDVTDFDIMEENDL